MFRHLMTKLLTASKDTHNLATSTRPKVRLGCEQYEERINPAGDGWLDTYASYFPDIGLGDHVLYPIVNLVFSDETLANATDTQLAVGTAGVVVVAVVGAEVATVAVTGTSIGGVITGGSAAASSATVAVGGSAAEVTIVNGVATVEIGFLQNASREFMRAVVNAARQQGANTLVVETGPVVNADLAIKLGLAAQRGETVLGGTVTLVPGATGPGTVPLFRIVWQAIPALSLEFPARLLQAADFYRTAMRE